ncbi:hypothetical protein Sm713_21470 [Streptomyces sp. TS71-3]|nr:hypothetical protein Sm713_21470 [Streptomyces sp. TS71-3]
MARGGFCTLPDGTVVVALTLPRPGAAAGAAPRGAAQRETERDAPGAPGAQVGAAAPPRNVTQRDGSGRDAAEAAAPADATAGGGENTARTARVEERTACGDERTARVDDGTVRVVVHAVNRSRALTRLRNFGLRSVYLRGNSHPPTPDEVTAVLHHPDGLIWRAAPPLPTELWHPIRALFARTEPGAPDAAGAPGTPARPGAVSPLAAGPDQASALATARRLYTEAPLTVPVEWTTATGHESGGLTGA